MADCQLNYPRTRKWEYYIHLKALENTNPCARLLRGRHHSGTGRDPGTVTCDVGNCASVERLHAFDAPGLTTVSPKSIPNEKVSGEWRDAGLSVLEAAVPIRNFESLSLLEYLMQSSRSLQRNKVPLPTQRGFVNSGPGYFSRLMTLIFPKSLRIHI